VKRVAALTLLLLAAPAFGADPPDWSRPVDMRCPFCSGRGDITTYEITHAPGGKSWDERCDHCRGAGRGVFRLKPLPPAEGDRIPAPPLKLPLTQSSAQLLAQNWWGESPSKAWKSRRGGAWYGDFTDKKHVPHVGYEVDTPTGPYPPVMGWGDTWEAACVAVIRTGHLPETRSGKEDAHKAESFLLAVGAMPLRWGDRLEYVGPSRNP
jgi:hypothetical protein